MVNPSTYYQRWRWEEYKLMDEAGDRPFFQWRYFSLKDYERNRNYELTLGASYRRPRSAGDHDFNAVFISFGVVDTAASPPHWVQYELLDLDSLTMEGDYNWSVQREGQLVASMVALDDNTFQLQGHLLANSPDRWQANCSAGKPAPAHDVQFNVTLYRIYGYYAQQDVEPFAVLSGWIMWDTYSHDAELEGHILVDGQLEVAFERSPLYRAYGGTACFLSSSSSSCRRRCCCD